MGSSVAYKTRGAFLSRSVRQEDDQGEDTKKSKREPCGDKRKRAACGNHRTFCTRRVTFRRVAVSLRGPGQSPVPPLPGPIPRGKGGPTHIKHHSIPELGGGGAGGTPPNAGPSTQG